MEFNENWNKSDNDLLREMNKEGKSTQDIINFFGMGKLKFHPTKFKYGNIIPYERFINEIIIQSEKVWYNINQRTSEIDNTKYDYLISFEIKKQKYIIILLYNIIQNKDTHIVAFTTQESFDDYNEYLNNISNLTNEDIIKSIIIFEKTTNLNEIYNVMKSISYILFDIIQNYNISLSIMEGNDKRRINLYRNIIKNSFQNLEESEVIVDGKMLYLYNKKEVI